MTKQLFSVLAAVATATLTGNVSAQTQLSGHGFTDAGAYRLNLSGAGDVEVSQDLQSWSHYASVTQPTGLDDLSSRGAERRFYRLRGSSNVIGYVKVTIPPGKVALLGNSFAAPLRLDTPEGRHAVFGLTNPPVKVSLYTNANFLAHTLDAASGAWTPPLRPIRAQEGFALQNTGSTPLTVRMSGPVRQGRMQTMIPAGGYALAAPSPNTGPAAQLTNIPAQDGTQVVWFDEQTQAYQTSTFDTLEKPGKWQPKLPEVQPGRAVVVKSPQPITLTNTLPAR
jgi:hypothetical protein